MAWELKGHFPEIFEDEQQGEAARKLYAEANEFLDEVIEKKMIAGQRFFRDLARQFRWRRYYPI
jgi:5-methyltetrahydrofolate--homocysteine methyltransferase